MAIRMTGRGAKGIEAIIEARKWEKRIDNAMVIGTAILFLIMIAIVAFGN